MKKIFSILFLAITIYSVPNAKADYTTSFGARLGKFATGASLKHFFDARGNIGFELWGTITREANSGYMGKGFFVKQVPIFNSKLQIPVDMVFGVGGHFGLFKENFYRIRNGEPEYYDHNALNAGIDAQFGLEYNSRRVPVTVGIDVNPYYGLLNPGPEWLDMGVTVRFKF
ncbi:MAG TPA: hypothetical protein PKK99_01225 [Bacteroidia bacterium]|nr:hypothetical protein [Bacteroidia bacterium]HNP97642.1 hypothetical protein [Bacteroidia bacterium]